jgi:hypothetical protein
VQVAVASWVANAIAAGALVKPVLGRIAGEAAKRPTGRQCPGPLPSVQPRRYFRTGYCSDRLVTAIVSPLRVPVTITFQSLTRSVALMSFNACSLPLASNLITRRSLVTTA